MTKKADGWISRRGQVGAATAIELVLERQPQEPVQQIADELIEDSPYQARQLISDASVTELAQGMQAAGFQGVLIVRPHGDIARRRQGMFQLVYGHRRRAAWRLVCQERGEACLLPVVVREISDAQLLTIGAQENLQRQDLDPVEEGQIIAWAERMYFDKNQAEIGALFGKSEDWVRLRSRVAKLPEPLKERLRARPRAMSQILELGTLYKQDSQAALALADRVVHEQLTLEVVRQLLRLSTRSQREPTHSPTAAESHQPSLANLTRLSPTHTEAPARSICEETDNRSGAAAIVTPGTSSGVPSPAPQTDRETSLTDQLHHIRLTIARARQQIDRFQATCGSDRLHATNSSDAATLRGLLDTITLDIDALRTVAVDIARVLEAAGYT